jgi:hypothetical protein
MKCFQVLLCVQDLVLRGLCDDDGEKDNDSGNDDVVGGDGGGAYNDDSDVNGATEMPRSLIRLSTMYIKTPPTKLKP